MSSIPDWVVDSRLETHFLPGVKHETVHTYYEQESLTQRPIKKSEHWQWEKKIGDGGFGKLWLERCTKGKNVGSHVRATKEMSVRRQVDYARELEAIAKFSHQRLVFQLVNAINARGQSRPAHTQVESDIADRNGTAIPAKGPRQVVTSLSA